MPDRDRILAAKLNGTAQNRAAEDVPLDQAVADVTELASGRTDLLAEQAASMLGSYLGRPWYVAQLRAALILATAAGEIDGPAFVSKVDEVRGIAGGEPHGRPKFKPDGVAD